MAPLPPSAPLRPSAAIPKAVVARLKTAPLQLIDSTAGRLANVGPIAAGELWRCRGLILFAVRRAGCSLCREQALDLSELVQRMRSAGELDAAVPLVAVVKQVEGLHPGVIGVREFATRYFAHCSVYYDPSLAAYRALGYDGRYRYLALHSGVAVAIAKRTALAPLGARLRRRGVANQEAGDKSEPFMQGGVLIVGPGQAGVHYRYQEVTGRRLPTDEIRAAILSMPRPVTWP